MINGIDADIPALSLSRFVTIANIATATPPTIPIIGPLPRARKAFHAGAIFLNASSLAIE